MARTAKGYTVKAREPGGVQYVRFTHKKRRHQISTRERDPKQAAEIAARIFADVVSGRYREVAGGALIHPTSKLDELCADWLDAIANELGEDTGVTYEVYARHWCAAMPTLGDVTSAGIGSFQRERLGHVTRVTVVKERSALRRMLTWFVERGVLGDVPDFPALPRKAAGQRHKQGRRKPAGVLTAGEAEAILEALSERTRPFFEALWETGLRPRSTLERLKRSDLTPFGLHIRPEADKNRWERTVPLTPRARAALERGLPFGRKDRRDAFAAAVKRALGEGRKVTPYDLKHARVTALIDSGAPIGGVEFLTGTKDLRHYRHATRGAAEVALRCKSGAANPSPNENQGAKEGTRTPMGVTPLAPQATPGHETKGETEKRARENSAENSTPPQLSGALHRNLPAVVSVALFKRSRGAS